MSAWPRHISTLFGVGRAPYAPGTAGSLVALPFAFAIHHYAGPVALFTAAVAVSALGIWASEIYARDSGSHDPSECVIDEVAGQWFACAFAPLTWTGYVLAFLLFRLFDMTKPWPISAAERNVGGLGVMLDDIVAGLVAGLVLLALVHWGVI